MTKVELFHGHVIQMKLTEVLNADIQLEGFAPSYFYFLSESV